MVRGQVWDKRKGSEVEILFFFFKGRGGRVRARFHLFVSDVNETKDEDVFKIFLRSRRDGKTLPRSNVSCSKCSPVRECLEFVMAG